MQILQQQLSLVTFDHSSGTKADLVWLSLDRLEPHPRNPRRGEPDKLQAIVESMKSEGYRPEKPMLVRPIGDDSYQIIGGHTRLQAAKLAGLERVLCVVEAMPDDVAILRLGEDNLNDPFSWVSECIYIAENSKKSSKTGLSRSALVKACSGKTGNAAEKEGSRKGAVGEFLLKLEKQTDNVVRLLTPETNLTSHLYALSKLPEQYQEQLVSRLLSERWTVKQVEAIAADVSSIEIPEHLQFWLDPDDAIKATISERLNGTEVRTPRDIKNWVTAAEECLGILPDNRRVVTIENDRESIEYHNLKIEFLDKLPELNQGAHKPSVKKIHAMAETLLNWADTMDRTHVQWLAERADTEAKKRRIEAEKRQELLNRQRFTPEGINAPLQTLKMEDIGGNFDLVLTDVPYLLSNGGDTVRGGSIVKVDKNFEDARGQAIEPSEYMPLFFEILKPGGYFVTTCSHHTLQDLLNSGMNAGFTLRQALVWAKPSAPPSVTTDRFQSTCEFILVLLKPGATPYFGYEDVKLDGKQRGNVFEIPQCSGNERLGWHDTQKPLELYELLIRAYCPPEGKILEPFAGSGTTAVAAKRLGRMCTWVEQSSEFFHRAEERIASTPFHWEV